MHTHARSLINIMRRKTHISAHRPTSTHMSFLSISIEITLKNERVQKSKID